MLWLVQYVETVKVRAKAVFFPLNWDDVLVKKLRFK